VSVAVCAHLIARTEPLNERDYCPQRQLVTDAHIKRLSSTDSNMEISRMPVAAGLTRVILSKCTQVSPAQAFATA
jgi:hypothetical protein